MDLLDDAFIARLEHLEIFTRNINTLFYDSGYHGARRGGEVEFADYKAYSPGDDIRYIDWNVYGRLDTFVTKQFGAEEKKRTNILVDTSASMAFSNKRPLALRLAAALSAVALFSGDIVDIAAIGPAFARQAGPQTGRAGVFQLFDFIRNLECAGETDYTRSLQNFVHAKREPSRVIMIADLWSEEDPAHYLGILAGAETDVSLIHVLSKEELNPDFRGRFRICDLESGEELAADLGAEDLDRYREHMEAHLERVASVCRRHHMDYILIPDRLPLEEIIFGILRDQGIVR